MNELDYKTLAAAVARSAAAIRSVVELQPAGGKGDKVFPPTYVKDGRGTTKYAMESRRIDGRTVDTVLLDSVASQANRLEEALLEGWRREELNFPVVLVDFSAEEGLSDLEQITALQAPHRIADALLRDSLLDGKPFRYTEVGMAFTEARPNHATAMYRYCPTALLFGVWDSTGPKGGLGAKFQRALVSEIVGIDAVPGVKVASRIDPTGIERKAGPVYAAKERQEGWTHDPDKAEMEKGKPKLFGRKREGGTPAAINHGNIPPSIDAEAGGVTFEKAQQTTVLSFPALRRLKFPTDTEGRTISSERRADAERAAQTVLAALALCAITYQRENGYDLRARSQLVPAGPFNIELVPADGSESRYFGLSPEGARDILAEAHAAARDVGMGWREREVILQPAPKLCHLIRKSRELVAAGEAEEEDQA
jgi:CRISPR-associated protein Csb1